MFSVSLLRTEVLRISGDFAAILRRFSDITRNARKPAALEAIGSTPAHSAALCSAGSPSPRFAAAVLRGMLPQGTRAYSCKPLLPCG